MQSAPFVKHRYFYPRPPRGGRLIQVRLVLVVPLISTHALREEGDMVPRPALLYNIYFYPRPPRGGRHNVPVAVEFVDVISTHALREEGDDALP